MLALQSSRVLFGTLLVAVNTAAMLSLPRGESLFLQEFNPLLARDPQSYSICDGINCGNFCIPSNYHCCADGGAGCPIGSNCIPNGCCPVGKNCVGGGGTLSFGAPPPTLVFSTPSVPAYTPPSFTAPSFSAPAYTPPSFSAPSFSAPAYTPPPYTPVNPNTVSQPDNFQSFLSTAYPSTGTAGALGAASTNGFPAIGVTPSSVNAGGGAAISSFNLAISSLTAGLSLSPTVTPSPSKAGGSSSGGSSPAQAASGAEPVSKSAVLSSLVVVAGLIAVQML